MILPVSHLMPRSLTSSHSLFCDWLHTVVKSLSSEVSALTLSQNGISRSNPRPLWRKKIYATDSVCGGETRGGLRGWADVTDGAHTLLCGVLCPTSVGTVHWCKPSFTRPCWLIIKYLFVLKLTFSSFPAVKQWRIIYVVFTLYWHMSRFSHTPIMQYSRVELCFHNSPRHELGCVQHVGNCWKKTDQTSRLFRVKNKSVNRSFRFFSWWREPNDTIRTHILLWHHVVPAPCPASQCYDWLWRRRVSFRCRPRSCPSWCVHELHLCQTM